MKSQTALEYEIPWRDNSRTAVGLYRYPTYDHNRGRDTSSRHLMVQRAVGADHDDEVTVTRANLNVGTLTDKRRGVVTRLVAVTLRRSVSSRAASLTGCERDSLNTTVLSIGHIHLVVFAEAKLSDGASGHRSNIRGQRTFVKRARVKKSVPFPPNANLGP